jgi:hypothetical protein
LIAHVQRCSGCGLVGLSVRSVRSVRSVSSKATPRVHSIRHAKPALALHRQPLLDTATHVLRMGVAGFGAVVVVGLANKATVASCPLARGGRPQLAASNPHHRQKRLEGLASRNATMPHGPGLHRTHVARQHSQIAVACAGILLDWARLGSTGPSSTPVSVRAARGPSPIQCTRSQSTVRCVTAVSAWGGEPHKGILLQSSLTFPTSCDSLTPDPLRRAIRLKLQPTFRPAGSQHLISRWDERVSV